MNPVQIVLIVVDAVVGVTAVWDGIALAAGLEGERYPVEWLKRNAFQQLPDSGAHPGGSGGGQRGRGRAADS